jgi:MerR family redox-sensitive transcriptional activator SoxR
MKKRTIGQIAAQAGTPASTIRYYEQIGLLPAPGRVNGQRRYEDGIAQKLGVIRMAQQAGFTIAEIQSLLHDFPDDAPPSTRWQRLAQQKLAELDEQMRSLQAMKALLEQTLQCQCETLEECAKREFEYEEMRGAK